MPKNKGERGEIRVLKKIYRLIRRNDNETLVKIFGEDADKGIQLLDIETSKPIKHANDVKKSKSTSKADALIKYNKTNELMYISIKCENGNPPTVLNHTPRSAKCFQKDGDLSNFLQKLDAIIKKFNDARYKKEVGEDIRLDSFELSNMEKHCIINVVAYFMFTGTGSKRSEHACNAILEVIDPKNTDEWNYYKCETDKCKREYVEKIYDRLVVSLRDKGMPSTHQKACEPWIFYQDKTNKEKGSLHIRLKK